MNNEPTIQVREACPQCHGTGGEPEEVEMEGRNGTWKSFEVCSNCQGARYVQRWVPVSALRALLEDPQQR